MRPRPVQTRHRPGQRRGRLVAPFHPRPDDAGPGAQIVAEPADHQTDPLQVRALHQQLIQRQQQIGLSPAVADILGRRPGQALAPQHRLRRQHELPRPGDQTYPLQPVLQPRLRPSRPPEHLEGQLRRPVAIRGQRQILEHHIGGAAIGRGHPLDRLDQRIRRLVVRAAMHPHRHAAQVHRPPVGPDPPDPVDRPLAQRHGKAQRIVIVDRPRPALAARRRGPPLLEARRPDPLTGHPGAPEHTGHRRTVGRRLDLQRLQPRSPLPRRRQ